MGVAASPHRASATREHEDALTRLVLDAVFRSGGACGAEHLGSSRRRLSGSGSTALAPAARGFGG